MFSCFLEDVIQTLSPIQCLCMVKWMNYISSQLANWLWILRCVDRDLKLAFCYVPRNAWHGTILKEILHLKDFFKTCLEETTYQVYSQSQTVWKGEWQRDLCSVLKDLITHLKTHQLFLYSLPWYMRIRKTHVCIWQILARAAADAWSSKTRLFHNYPVTSCVVSWMH